MIARSGETSTAPGDNTSLPSIPNPARRPTAERLIGRLAGGAGPRVILVAGMHGNEPAGVDAAHAVIDRLDRDGIHLDGELVALRGNVRALREHKRYVAEDLNRLWTEDRVAVLRAGAPARDGSATTDGEVGPEQREQAELLAELDALIRTAQGEVVVVDLHSTSGPGAPFACISDTLRSRAIALTLPLPLVLGVEEAIHGTLLEHFENEGVPMVLLEGGRHDAADTALNLESAIWLILAAIGLIGTQHSAAINTHADRLHAATLGLPLVVEVTHRHHLADGAAFRMRHGLAHFDPVRRGQPLADDESGPVLSPADGLLVMPRYQVQGSDGFFLARPIRRSWLDVSRWARAARLDRLLPGLPGVSRDPLRPQRLFVDPVVARWFTVQLFHLSGFRRLPDRERLLVFTRRIEP
jgi:succinylglutamate desuccinylase